MEAGITPLTPAEHELQKRRQCVTVTAAYYWSEHEAAWLWWLKWLVATGRLAS